MPCSTVAWPDCGGEEAYCIRKVDVKVFVDDVIIASQLWSDAIETDVLHTSLNTFQARGRQMSRSIAIAHARLQGGDAWPHHHSVRMKRFIISAILERREVCMQPVPDG